jgi:protein NRD1
MSALPAKMPLPGQEIGPIPRAAPQPGKDEFGRDIRPASPSPEPPADIFGPPTQPSPPPPPPTAPPTAPVVRTQTVEPPPAALTSNHDQMSLTPSVDANTSSRAPDAAAIVSNKVPSQPGMENFSLATFDFTAPASWEALGKMWQVTHGYLPSTEQLMQFVMAGGVGAVATQQPQQQAADWTGSQNWGANQTMQPRRGGRGRGGFSRGRGFGGARDNQERGWHSDMGETDAIVLGGGDDDGMVVDAGQSDTGGGPGGRMQRVGEKWVFVRDPVANQS